MKRRSNLDLVLITLALLILNAPLITGGSTAHLAYSAAAVAQGEWWRLVTHPFVHVSRYHFLLDASAFLCLYLALPLQSVRQRLAAVATCAAAALWVPIVFSDHIATAGLRGLSGVSHGLMALSALLMWKNPETRLLGAASFIVVAGKSILEVASGNVFLASWHPGSVGLPIVETHLGGVLGGLLAWSLMEYRHSLLMSEAGDALKIGFRGDKNRFTIQRALSDGRVGDG